MIISLGRQLPVASSSLPGSRNGSGRSAGKLNLGRLSSSNAPLFGLAPGGVYRARLVTQSAGELLPHRFTLTTKFAPRGGLFSVALSLPGEAGRWALPTTAPYGVRTFLSAIREEYLATLQGRLSDHPAYRDLPVILGRRVWISTRHS